MWQSESNHKKYLFEKFQDYLKSTAHAEYVAAHREVQSLYSIVTHWIESEWQIFEPVSFDEFQETMIDIVAVWAFNQTKVVVPLWKPDTARLRVNRLTGWSDTHTEEIDLDPSERITRRQYESYLDRRRAVEDRELAAALRVLAGGINSIAPSEESTSRRTRK